MGIERRNKQGFKQKPNCIKCGASFHKVKRYTYNDKVRGKRFSNYCKSCYLEKLTKGNEPARQRIHDRKLQLIKDRGGKCPICGYSDLSCPGVFDFHHVNKTNKEFKISELLGRKIIPQKCLDEINKCLLICSNCHRKIHWSGV